MELKEQTIKTNGTWLIFPVHDSFRNMVSLQLGASWKKVFLLPQNCFHSSSISALKRQFYDKIWRKFTLKWKKWYLFVLMTFEKDVPFKIYEQTQMIIDW